MFKSYLLTALRSLSRSRIYSLINILGLSLGIASCLLLFLYLRFEWSHDRFEPDSGRIYRVINHRQPEGRDPYSEPGIPSVFRDAVQGTVPGIETTLRWTDDRIRVRHGDGFFEEPSGYADPEFFSFLGLPLVSGDPVTALTDPHSVVISRSLARKLYGDENPVGQVIELQDRTEYEPYTVAGVMQAIPANSRFACDIVIPFRVLEQMIESIYHLGWGSVFSEAYVKLAPDVTAASIEQGLHQVVAEHDLDNTIRGKLTFQLQPLSDTHVMLSNPRSFPTDTSPEGSIVLAAIALVILIIACINFTTLTVGRSVTRAREVGVRKVLGAKRPQIIRQFWVETGVISFIALLVSLGIVELALPAFNALAQSRLALALDPLLLTILAAIWLVVIAAAGSYPAVQLSSFTPSAAFRGGVRVGGKSRLRAILVLVQFTLSIALIVITFAMTRQLRFVQRQDLGYHGEQVVSLAILNQDDTGAKAVEYLRSALADDPDVLSVSGSSCAFGQTWTKYAWYDGPTEYNDIYQNTVDEHFLATLDVPVVQGRGFSPEHPADRQGGMLVNETLVRRLGIENPIGAPLPGPVPHGEIIGVVRDFHFSSLHEAIEPLVLTLTPFTPPSESYHSQSDNYITIQRVLVRIAPGDIPATLQRIERLWRSTWPNVGWDPVFLDDAVQQMYREDRRWSSIVGYGSGLAIAIALMGLLGLAALQVAQRTREIGIRKVLGATSGALVALLSREMTLLVLVANLVGLPLALLFVHHWLEKFAYRVPFGLGHALEAGAAVLLLAWIAVGILAWRTAHLNPVKTLRHE